MEQGLRNIDMAASIKFLPGATIRWHGRQYVIVDYGLDAILGREFGKRKLERIPIAEAQSDETARGRAMRTPDLVAVPENSWRTAVQKFKALRPLLEMKEGNELGQPSQKLLVQLVNIRRPSIGGYASTRVPNAFLSSCERSVRTVARAT
jgi:hypothetical protein